MQNRTNKISFLKRLISAGLIAVAVGFSAPLSPAVVLVIIDGARYSETLGDGLGRFTPRMHALAAQGVVANNFYNDLYTYTSRAIPAIWSGSWVIPRDTTVNGRDTQYTLVPSVWEYFRKATGYEKTQAFYLIKYLTSPWLPSYHPDYGPAYWPEYIVEGSNDAAVCAIAWQKLQTFHPRLAVVYLADVDHAGHSGEWNTYVNAISTADNLVGALWDSLQNNAYFRGQTTLLVTNDHGRHADGVASGFAGHGCGCEGCRHIMFFGLGPGVKKATQIATQYRIPDITPTIGALLDFSTPLVEGQVMADLLDESVSVTTGVKFCSSYALLGNYPNPCNPLTRIRYFLPVPENVRLTMTAVDGHYAQDLVADRQAAGYHEISWDVSRVSSGVYFYALQAGKYQAIGKCVVLK